MKIYGPFHMLNNPLVMTSLALDAVTAGASLYNAYEQSHANDFLTASMLKSEPVTSLPGGPIRHLLSKLPGGLVSPDVQATPEQTLQELGVLQQQRGEKLKEIGEYGKLRGEVGAGPFQAGGPFSADLTRLTGSDTTFAGQTLPEQREAEAERQREIANERLSPEGKAKAKQAELDVENSPINLMAALSRDRAKTTQDAAIRAGFALSTHAKEKAMDLAASTSPAALSIEEAKGFARAVGAGRGRRTVMEETPLGELKDYNVYDRNTLENLSQTKPDKKYGEIVKPSTANQYIHVKPGSKADLALQAAPKGIDDLNAMRQLILDDKKHEIFPLAGTNATLIQRGMSNWRSRKSNAKLNQFYSYMNDFIQQIRVANGGRVLGPELRLGAAFWPDPGTGNASRTAGIRANLEDDLGLDAGPSDTEGDALRKIQKLRNSTKQMALSTASSGIADDESTDVNDAVNKAMDDGEF